MPVVEPPEPRRPEEDGGETPQEEARRLAREQLERVHELEGSTDPVTDDEVTAYIEEAAELRNFLDSEYFAEMNDDLLLDEIGQGEDHRTIFDEMPPGEDDLQDALHDIHEQPDDEPIPELVSVDEAMQIIAEAKAKHDKEKSAEPTGPRQITERGAPNMINEGAQILGNIANNANLVQGMVTAAEDAVRTAAAALQEAITVLNQHAGEAATAAGGDEGESLNGMGQTASAALDDALSKVAMFDPTEVQGQIEQFYRAVGDAAAKHSS